MPKKPRGETSASHKEATSADSGNSWGSFGDGGKKEISTSAIDKITGISHEKQYEDLAQEITSFAHKNPKPRNIAEAASEKVQANIRKSEERAQRIALGSIAGFNQAIYNLGNLGLSNAATNPEIAGQEMAVANSAQSQNTLAQNALATESLPPEQNVQYKHLDSESTQAKLKMLSDHFKKMVLKDPRLDALMETLKSFSADPEWPEINDSPKSFHPTINQQTVYTLDQINGIFSHATKLFRQSLLPSRISETIDSRKDCFSFARSFPEDFKEKTLDTYKLLCWSLASDAFIDHGEASSNKILDLLKEDFHVIFSQAENSYLTHGEDGKFLITVEAIEKEIFIDQECVEAILKEIQNRKNLAVAIAEKKERLLSESALNKSDLSESKISKLISEMRETMPKLTLVELNKQAAELQKQVSGEWEKTPLENKNPSMQYVKDKINFLARERVLSDALIILEEGGGISFLKPNPNHFEEKAIDALKAALFYAITKEFLDKEHFNLDATKKFLTQQFRENFKVIISQNEIDPAKRGANGEFFVLAKRIEGEVFINPEDIKNILTAIQQEELTSNKKPSPELKGAQKTAKLEPKPSEINRI